MTTPKAVGSIIPTSSVIEAVAGRAREGVVVVVPALAEGEGRDDPVVAAFVACRIGAPAEHVADGVHGEGGVLVREDADRAGPDKRLKAEREAEPTREVAEQERQPEGEHDPERIHAIDGAHHGSWNRSRP